MTQGLVTPQWAHQPRESRHISNCGRAHPQNTPVRSWEPPSMTSCQPQPQVLGAARGGVRRMWGLTENTAQPQLMCLPLAYVRAPQPTGLGWDLVSWGLGGTTPPIPHPHTDCRVAARHCWTPRGLRMAGRGGLAFTHPPVPRQARRRCEGPKWETGQYSSGVQTWLKSKAQRHQQSQQQTQVASAVICWKPRTTRTAPVAFYIPLTAPPSSTSGWPRERKPTGPQGDRMTDTREAPHPPSV